MKNRIEELQKEIDYYSYCKLLENGFDEKKLHELYYLIHEDGSDYSYGGYSIQDQPQGAKQIKNDLSLEYWIEERHCDEPDYQGGFIYVKITDKLYLCWYANW